MLVLKDGAGSHPEAITIRPSVFRALRNRRKRGFAHSIGRRTRSVSLSTSAGLYLGRRLAFDVDLRRLDRVIERITKGLFWHHQGYRIPDDLDVVAYTEDGLQSLSSADRTAIQMEVVAPVLRQPVHCIGGGAVRYWYAFALDHPSLSAWIYEFYSDVRFVAVIIPADGE